MQPDGHRRLCHGQLYGQACMFNSHSGLVSSRARNAVFKHYVEGQLTEARPLDSSVAQDSLPNSPYDSRYRLCRGERRHGWRACSSNVELPKH